jgi:hypothetical protein
MKKLVLALIVALTLAPFSAFGLEMMTDDSMKDVTAQAGVAIAVDDIVLESHVGAVKYIDVDGTGLQRDGSADQAGALVIGARHRIQEINAMYGATSPGDEPGIHAQHYNYEAFGAIAPLVIDVGTLPTLSYGLNVLKQYLTTAPQAALGGAALTAAGDTVWNARNWNQSFGMSHAQATNTGATNVVGVMITLPTVEIYTHSDIYSISAEIVDSATGATETDASYHNNGETYIRIMKDASALGICGGRIEIAPK